MKKIVSRVLCLLMVFSVLAASGTAFAAPPELSTPAAGEIEPRYEDINLLSASLTIDDLGKATCTSIAKGSAYSKLELTMTLYDENGSVKTWTNEAIHSVSLSENWYVPSGHTYHLEVSVSVYNARGILIDYATTPSNYVTF